MGTRVWAALGLEARGCGTALVREACGGGAMLGQEACGREARSAGAAYWEARGGGVSWRCAAALDLERFFTNVSRPGVWLGGVWSLLWFGSWALLEKAKFWSLIYLLYITYIV